MVSIFFKKTSIVIISGYLHLTALHSNVEISLSKSEDCVHYQNQKTELAHMGIEPMTFALLARRSNQLS